VACVGKRHDVTTLYNTDLCRYNEIEGTLLQACARYDAVRGLICQPQPPVESLVFCDAFLQTQTLQGCMDAILNATKWMKPLYGLDRRRLLAALALIADADVDFAARVFDALLWTHGDDAAYTFKMFTSFLRLARFDALHMAGDPVCVVGWIYERC